MNNLFTQFRGDKMRNHILYPTPLIALEISDKEGAAVDTIFCPPLIYVSNPKKPKNIISLHGVTRTYVMAWHNLFEHWSAQSAFFSQNDQNALGQPWIDRKSYKVKILKKNIFHGFISNSGSSKIFINFDQVWPGVNSWWAPKTLILIRSSKQVETNAIAKIIKFSFQWLFMGRNWS